MKNFSCPYFPKLSVFWRDFRPWLAGLAAGVVLVPVTSSGAEAGAWERFPTQANADAWTVYDAADGENYYPAWEVGESGDGIIYFAHTGDKALWFFTDIEGGAGGGVLVGDYAAERIRGIRCDIGIKSLADFDSMDCVVYSGAGEGRYYYSEPFFDFDFDEAGWWTLSFNFDELWYFWDENAEEYVPVEMTAEILSSVEEIGFRFFPKEGTTAEVDSALADVKLIPTVEPADLHVSSTGGEFALAFTPGNGIECKIERKRGSLDGAWEPVPGESGIIGTEEHRFATPLGAQPEFFRVLSDEHYTPFVTGG